MLKQTSEQPTYLCCQPMKTIYLIKTVLITSQENLVLKYGTMIQKVKFETEHILQNNVIHIIFQKLIM